MPLQLLAAFEISSQASKQFAEHIGVSDNQLLLGVLESVFFFLFRAMAGLLAGDSGGGILQVTSPTGPLFLAS